MKVRITLAVALVAVLVTAFAAVAGAATESTTTGTLTTVQFKASGTSGKLHVRSAKGTSTTIGLNSKTDCGVAYGQSGDQVPCKSLTAAKYKGKPVRVVAKKYSDGHRTATLVAVDLSGR